MKEKMTENCRNCQKLLIRLHGAMLFSADGNGGEESDKIRDDLEGIWYKLSNEEEQNLRFLSEDLHLIDFPDVKDKKFLLK
jgi:hypothetical protein